jgi:glycosyltransferase involved in cell wall biosynthesis
MKAKRVVYIPGIGIDTDYYENTVIDKDKKRGEFGIPMNAFVILSVGELNQNKNHIVIINAIEKLNNENIYYVICGEGTEKNSLLSIIEEKKLDRQVVLTGLRYDVNEFYKMADLFAFPSKREGLGLAALEAMASGLSLVTSNKNGIKDYAKDGETGYMCEPDDVDAFAEAIKKMMSSQELREEFGQHNKTVAKDFGEITVDKIMKQIYIDVMIER